MLKGHDILCISSIDWDFIWQGHQEIMSTLAGSGNRVLFLENTGVRAPGLKDLPRLRQRLHNWLRSVKGFRQVQENLVVYSPLLLPFPYSRLARWINRWLLLRALRRWMKAMAFGRPIIWTFLPTPLTRDVIRELEPLFTIYYCIDDFSSSSRQAHHVTRSERQLFQQADLVFVTSEKLRERAAVCTDRVHVFPFGVSFKRFEEVRNSVDDVPTELRTLPHPVVGYIGGVHQWIDQDLLVQAAQRLSNASFVLIGPTQTDIAKLTRCPNVHLLGKRAHTVLPRYIKGFDVGIVPYRISDYTAHVYPTKLNEYLAMGIPVVTTDLPEIRRFNAKHGDLVAVAHNAAQFTEAIQGVRRTPEEVRRRIDVARLNSWDVQIDRMSTLIQEAIATRQATPTSWEETLRRMYRVTRRQVLGSLVAIGLACAVLFYTPLIWVVAEPLRITEPPRRADVIIVFAGGVGESGRPGQGYEERVAWAVELYQQRYAEHLLFSSGSVYAFREPNVMKALAMSLGIAPQAILLETQSTSTVENVTKTNDLLNERGWTSALLVSSPYHMRRASLVWRRIAPDKRMTYVPMPDSLFYRHGVDGEGRPVWQQATAQHIRAIAHEYLAITYYWLRGWI